MAKNLRPMQPPWTVTEGDSSFTIRTANGFAISVIYYDDEPKRPYMLRREEARRIAINVCRLPELLGRPTI